MLVLLAAGYIYFFHVPGLHSPSTSGPPPSLISLLPTQAPYVVYADLDALRKSEFLARLVAIAPTQQEDPEYTEFVRETGFDYTRDLDRVAIAIFPGSPNAKVVALAEGRFDQQKITAYALRTGKTVQREGRTTYIVPASTTGEEVTVNFLAPNRIELISEAVGTPPDPPAASPKSDPEMQERVSRVAGSAIFAVARTDAAPKGVTLGTVRLDDIESALKGVQWITLAGVPEGQNLRVVLEGECDSITGALNLDLTLGGFRIIGRAAMAAPSTRKQFTPKGADALTKLLSLVDISHTGKIVRVMVAFTPDLLDGLAAPPPHKPTPAPVAAPAKPAH